MLPIAYYLLKVIICAGILFGYYWLMLRNKVFHQYNRFYLLAIVAVSPIVPLLQFNIWHNADEPAPQAIKLLQAVNSSNEYLDEIVLTSKQSNFSTEQALMLLYLTISIVLLSLFIYSLIRIRNLFIKHQHSFFENIFFVNTTAKGTPFSFLRYIFWNDLIDPESTAGNQIFKHELAHVQQKHSYDKLFINAMLIFFWCVPFFWLIRKELNMIHEFMADKIAVEDSDTEAFAAMILQATYPQHRFHLNNPFFYSPIKRRLIMLTKSKNPRVNYFGRILALPLALFVFAAFTLKTKLITNNVAPVFDGKKITVVIDAGHGGTDAGAQSIDGNTREKDLTLAIIKKIKTLNKNSGIKILFTRESDISQTVNEKANFTNAQNADLFISIHIAATSNIGGNSNTGMNVYVARDKFANSGGSKLFASAIIQEFSNGYELPVTGLPLQREEGIKVLQASDCPSVIIEPGYITNNKDLAYLKTPAGQEIIAGKILAAVEKYAIAKEKGETGTGTIISPSKQNITVKKADTIPKIKIKNIEKALIIVDGKTITREELKKISPDNIQQISVIKDTAALAQYGEKGKDGVIIITTRPTRIIVNNLNVNTQRDSISTNINVNEDIKIRTVVNLKTEVNPANKPLYVVDGKVETKEFNLNSISPNDIVSVNVLKGETATNKYGKNGTNGVIEIITKGKPALKLTTSSGNTKDNKESVAAGTGTMQKNQQSQNEPIFTKVENEPQFPGGDAAFKRYVTRNLKTNLPVQEGWKAGTYMIVVSFIVKKDGSIIDVRTNDYAGSNISKHCIDLIRKGPKWKPAIQNGKVVSAYRKQPFTFAVK